MTITSTIRYLAIIILALTFASCSGRQSLSGGNSAVSAKAGQIIFMPAYSGILRSASTAPTGSCNHIDGLAIAGDGVGGWELTWNYKNHGDYNLDGIVDISDVTQIAMHFGESDSVIGEHGDGIVGVGNITPIAQHFTSELAGYLVESSTSPSGPYAEVGRIYFNQLSGASVGLAANFPLTAINNDYFLVTPFDGDNSFGEPSDPYTSGLGAPEISSVMPQSASVGVAVPMLAEVTGEGLKAYSWAFGTGALPVASNEESPSVVFTQAGIIDCSLTVTTIFGSDSFDFAVAVTDPDAAPYITAVHPQSGLAGVVLTFSAEAGGEEPLVFSWTFAGGDPAASSERTPTVTFAESGNHSVSLTVANTSGSAVYNYSLNAIAGLDMELIAIRVILDGATNTLGGSIYLGTPKFAMPLSGNAKGEALINGNLHGYLDSFSYYYPPGGDPYGFDDPPPIGHDMEYEATLEYLSTKLDWGLSLGGHTEADLFTHNLGELPGQLLGNLGNITDTYILTAEIPEGVLGLDQANLIVIDLNVLDL